MEHKQQDDTIASTGDAPIKPSRWAEASQNIDSPRFDPLEAFSNIKISPLNLDAKPTPPATGGHWRKPFLNDSDRNLTFDVNISNIDIQVNKHMVKNFFKSPPTSITMKTNLGRQIAIVSFKTREDAHAALSLNGKIPANCHQQTQKLTVSFHSNVTPPPLMDTPTPQPRFQNPSNTNNRDFRGNLKTFNSNDHNSSSPNNITQKNSTNFHGSFNEKSDNKNFNSRYSSPRESSKYSFKSNSSHTSTHTSSQLNEQKSRVPLNLSKRTLPIEEVASVTNARNTAIFGHAQPIINSGLSSTQPKSKENLSKSSQNIENNFNSEVKINKSNFDQNFSLSKAKDNSPQIPFKQSQSDSMQLDSNNDFKSPKDTQPQKSFLRSVGSEIKRRINADHNQTSTSTKTKSNPYGEATPVDIKDITETRKHEKESSCTDYPQESNDSNMELDSKLDFSKPKQDSSIPSVTTFAPLLDINNGNQGNSFSNSEVDFLKKSTTIDNSSENSIIQPIIKNEENIWQTRIQHENSSKTSKLEEKFQIQSSDQFNPKNDHGQFKSSINDQKTENSSNNTQFQRDFLRKNIPSNNAYQKFSKPRRGNEFRSYNKIESSNSFHYSSDNKNSTQHLQYMKENKPYSEFTPSNLLDRKSIKSKSNSTYLKRNSAEETQTSYVNSNLDTNNRSDYAESSNKNKFEYLHDKSDNSRTKTFKVNNTGGSNLNTSDVTVNQKTSNSIVPDPSQVKTQNRYSVLNFDEIHE